MKERSIGHVILSKTLPRLLVFSALSVLLLTTILYFLNEREKESHYSNILDQFIQSYRQTIVDQLDSLSSLAAQPFVIRALVEHSSTERQLFNSYLQSLNFGPLRYISISVFDRNGQMFSRTGHHDTLQNIEDEIWYARVFERQKNYYNAAIPEPFFVLPVIVEDEVFGAVLGQTHDLGELIPFTDSYVDIMVVNSSDQIIISTDNETFPSKNRLSTNALKGFYTKTRNIENDLAVILVADGNPPPFQIIHFVSISFFSLLFVILGSTFGIRYITRLATDTIREFLDAVKSISADQLRPALPKSPGQARELNELQNEFNLLMAKLSESRLSESRISALMNSMNDLQIVFDLTGQPVFYNRAFEYFLESVGIHKDKILKQVFYGKPSNELLDLNQTLKKLEKRYLKSDVTTGSAFMSVQWTRHPLLDENSQTIGIIFVGLDTTASEKMQTEIQLRDAAIDGADSGIFIVEIKRDITSIIYANRGITKLTGIQPENLNISVQDLLQQITGSNELYERIRASTLTNQSATETFVRRLPSGKERHLEVRLSFAALPISTTSDFYLGILTDVTEKALTEQLLMEAKTKAEESAQMKSNFLASMSHEIRTPMNGVIGMLEIIHDTSLTDEQKEYVEIAQSSAESLLAIINDILDFSKVEAGKLIIEKIDFNLDKMLKSFVHSMNHLASSKKLNLILQTQNTDQHVNGDPGRLRQVLTNLVSNAIKFTEKGSITVNAKLSNNDTEFSILTVSVTDTGMGIAKEKQATLFDPFTQVDGSHSRSQQGTGLGLAIVKQLIEVMNGEVWLNSTLGVGSSFGFHLPLHINNMVKQPVKQLETETKLIENFPCDLTILLVEDNEVNQIITRRFLDSMNLQTIIAHDGQAALNTLQRIDQSVDLILMDCQMPVMDGLEATRRIRNGEAGTEHQQTPIIAMTANAMKGDRENCIAAGMDDYLSKPLRKDDLRNALLRWLKEEKTEKSWRN